MNKKILLTSLTAALLNIHVANASVTLTDSTSDTGSASWSGGLYGNSKQDRYNSGNLVRKLSGETTQWRLFSTNENLTRTAAFGSTGGYFSYRLEFDKPVFLGDFSQLRLINDINRGTRIISLSNISLVGGSATRDDLEELNSHYKFNPRNGSFTRIDNTSGSTRIDIAAKEGSEFKTFTTLSYSHRIASDWTNVTFEVDLDSLFSGFQAEKLSSELAGTTLNGAHHRLLIDTPLDNTGWATWATGDFSRFSQTDSNLTAGEVGASTDFGIKNFRAGLGVGHSVVDQDTAFGGGSNINGEFVVAEANYIIPNSKFIVSALGYYGDYTADIDRGYSTGGDFSTATTDLRSYAVRLRADWKNLIEDGKLSVTPRFAYTYTDTAADAYTETGGFTPASFERQHSQNHEFRLGFDFDYAHTPKTTVRTMIEVVNRLEDNENLRGTVNGINFSLPGKETRTTWGRLGFEVLHQYSENTSFNASIFGSTEGYDATVSGAIGFNMTF